MRKQICRMDETLRRLESLVAKLKTEGTLFLPAERPLCETLGVSRMTLRKAVEALETRGVLETGARGRVISANAVPEPKGTLLFVARGVDWIVVPAWNRLWTRLENLARTVGYACKLKLVPPGATFDATGLEDATFIVHSGLDPKTEAEFMEFARGRANVIGVVEEHAEKLKHVVCLDNRVAGRLAAKILLDAGYRRPALLRAENATLAFARREEGFLEELARRLPNHTAPCHVVRCHDMAEYVRGYLDALEGLAASDVDSLFVATDELITLAYDIIAHARDIPGEFGLVTLAGSHESLIHQPPVTAVGHGSSRVASALLELMERISDGRQPDKPSLTLVEPGVHAGATANKPTRSL